ncbi:MAG: IS110 family transposase [Bryobacteraceae bacterium]
MLCQYAHLVLFPVHSATVANYRQACSPSGGKSDPADADLILDLLLKHPDRLQRLQPDTVETRGLQFLTEERRKRVDRQTPESQRLTNGLQQAFPQISSWFDDPASPLVGGSAAALAEFAGPAESLCQNPAHLLPSAQLPQ